MIDLSVRLRYMILAGLLCVGVSVVLSIVLFPGDPSPKEIWAAYQAGGQYAALEITYPFDGALFPPEIIAPTFRWKEKNTEVDTWLVWIEFKDQQEPLGVLASKNEWTPSDEQWDIIKHRSLEMEAKVSILGVNRAAPYKILSVSSIAISTSKDEVGAPLFYREVNLPFSDAITDPAKYIRWRFGVISSKEKPPVVLENIPTCANCHSFSADGSTLAMEVDSANDKGSYVIAPVAEEIIFDDPKIITWSDYKKEDGQKTFGLLAQISPDGKNVMCMVKDRSVFTDRPDLAFSQLFFPVQGILVYYRRETQTFHALPGADDKEFVQANPAWSPDGKTILFARHTVYHLKEAEGNQLVLLSDEETEEFLSGEKTFLFDLYRIPFNNGKGGHAVPLEGASDNGMSNYFPKYSPDGKWIVFCKAKSFMLLQPDSELYIMPAGGGQARRMRCNTSRMNSWHSWSPNGKWMVFSSKVNGPYTQLFLTHIDQQGRSTPPVLLENFSSPQRAANIPEFVNVKPGAIKKIQQKFIDDRSFVRAGHEFLKAGDLDGAERVYRKALKLNPNNFDANNRLATILTMRGNFAESVKHYRKVVELKPKNGLAHSKLGIALFRLRKNGPAYEHVKKALELDPGSATVQYNWATTLLSFGKADEAIVHLEKAIEINPKHIMAYFNLGIAYDRQGKLDQAITQYRKVIELDPGHAVAHNNLGVAVGKKGKLDQAIVHFSNAVAANPKYAAPHHNWAGVLVSLGKTAQAVDQYQQAIDLNPNNIKAISILASLLATCPTDSIRDGARAVKLAKRACKATGYRVPQVIATLAAAYAEEGKFAKAADTARKALQLVHVEQQSLADQIRQQLQYYKANKPYRLQRKRQGQPARR
jgi:tetratricopeptide (TPR) repeat protein/Tol biopolymer transport system component